MATLRKERWLFSLGTGANIVVACFLLLVTWYVGSQSYAGVLGMGWAGICAVGCVFILGVMTKSGLEVFLAVMLGGAFGLARVPIIWFTALHDRWELAFWASVSGTASATTMFFFLCLAVSIPIRIWKRTGIPPWLPWPWLNLIHPGRGKRLNEELAAALRAIKGLIAPEARNTEEILARLEEMEDPDRILLLQMIVRSVMSGTSDLRLDGQKSDQLFTGILVIGRSQGF